MLRKALIVGLQNYPYQFLHGCHDGANSIERLLKRHEDGSVNFDCKLLIDKRNDDENAIDQVKLRKNIIELFDVPKIDTVLFYFSGHGALTTRGGFIVTPDSKKFDEGIRMDEILDLANNSRADNKVIILDCCNSGAFGEIPHTNGNITQIGEGVTVLSACMKNQNTIGNDFTDLLIEALKGGAADLTGNITAGSVYWFIDRALSAWGPRPVFKTVVNSYIPIRKVKPLIPLEILRKLTDYFKKADDEYPLNPSYEFTSPEANPSNVVILKDLQKMVSVGLVKPVNEEHMYFAAMNSKSCKLTSIGHCFWRFLTDGRI